MLNIDWVKILEHLKGITGFRFYFLVMAIVILIITFMFKDEISTGVKNFNFKQVEFREARDLKGLEVNLSTLTKDENVSDYIVYIYQPKEKPYYKKLLLTSSDLVKSVMRLQGSFIEDQATINQGLKDNNYIILSKEDMKPDTQYLHELGMDYILVYRLGAKQAPLGELQVVFKNSPTNEEIQRTIKKLTPMMHMYII